MVRLSSDVLAAQLRGLWTQSDIAKLAKRSPMAVYLWCRRAKDPLPCVPIPGFKKDGVRFVPTEVRAWCRRNHIELHEEEERGKRKRVALRAA